MADERVVIKIDTTYDGSGAKKAIRDLNRLEASENKFSSGQKRLQNQLNKTQNSLANSFNRVKRNFDFFDSAVKMSGNVLKKFVTGSLKLVTIEMGLLGLAMVGVHGLFVAGKFLAKAYAGAMQIIAGGAASAAVAIATAAAAIREQQAAMFAYRGRGAGEFGSGLNQARVAMRGLQMDSSLAGLGVANLNKAYAAMSKSMSTPQINASASLFKSLMDFGSAGQDPGAAAEKVGAMIAALSDSKKSLSDVTTAAKEIGPEMEDALKKANVKTKEQLKQLIMSGELAKIGGVAGQFDAVNQTLIGQAKTFFSLIRGQFADFGQKFLEPAKASMQEIFQILQRDINRMMVSVSGFGMGNFMTGLVNTIDRVSTWTVEMVQKWLPKTEGMWSRLAGWWERFTNGWKRMVDALRPMIDGARVIERAFSPIWQAIKEGGIDNFRVMREELLANEDTILDFGNRIADLIRAISKFSQNLKKAIMDILPLINNLITGFTQVFTLMSSTLTKFAGTGMFGSLVPLMFMYLSGRQMSQTRGGFLSTGLNRNMTVNAQNVSVNGVGIGGPVAPQAMPSGQRSPGFASGARGQFIQTPQGLFIPAATGPTSKFTPMKQTKMANLKNATRSFGWMGGWGTPAVGPLGQADPYERRVNPNTGQPVGRLTDLRERNRYLRTQSRFGAGLFGNEKLGIKGVNNSMGARMGVGLGLSMLSSVAPESMQGAMALGGTVGMFNPLAGLAVAGVGGALTAESAKAGAIAGAMGGAAIGSFFPVVGTALGAAIGGVAGALIGSVNRMRKDAERVKKTISASFDSLLSGVFSVAYDQISANRRTVEAGGTVSGAGVLGRGSDMIMQRLSGLRTNLATQRRIRATQTDQNATFRAQQSFFRTLVDDGGSLYGLNFAEGDYDRFIKNPESAFDELEKRITEIAVTHNALDDVYTERLRLLSQMTGKSGAEIEVLAQQLGVNLTDATVNFMDVAKQLGATMAKTGDQMKSSFQDVFLASTDALKKEIEAKKASFAIDEKIRVLTDKQQAGTLTDLELQEFALQLPADLAAMYQGDISKAYTVMQKTLGIGGTSYQMGGSAEGLEGRLSPLITGAISNSRTGFESLIVEQISKSLAGSQFAADQNQLKTLVSGMSVDQLSQTMSLLSQGKGPGSYNIPGRDPVLQFLQALGLGGLDVNRIDTTEADKFTGNLDEAATALGVSAKDFASSVQKFVDFGEGIFGGASQAPSWWNTAPSWWNGDTRTPRGDTTSSRLEQTMSRHSAMDSQLTGKRTVTSAFRTWGLGSPSSDHVKGRAYDLTGQNLGAYSKLVHANGGFAEFHGVGGGRHLHVVPGTGPYGDTTVPSFYTPPATSGQKSGTVINNYVTVNAERGQSTEEIARAVVRKIDERERNYRERS